MKPKFSLLAMLMLAVTLALVGVLRDVSTSKAIPPLPAQPFLADADGGLADTTLGLTGVKNLTYTYIPRGSRTTLPWIFSGPGWGLEIDKETEDETDVGTVTSIVDALCDSGTLSEGIDILSQANGEDCADNVPYRWVATTTAVEGTGAEFLKTIVPPFSWLTRHSAWTSEAGGGTGGVKDYLNNICLSGETPNATTSTLNTVYTNVPFSPNGSAFTATTKLGGDPVVPPADVCLDSPQTSVSEVTIYQAPKPVGDHDGPCTASNCADGSIYGPAAANTVTIATATGNATVPVSVTKVNNSGVHAGTFQLHWEAEVTDDTVVTATWPLGGTSEDDAAVSLGVESSTAVSKNLTLTCKEAGWSLVVIKNVLWPASGTKDIYPDDNANVFVEKVICVAGSEPAIQVDKEVIWIKPQTPAQKELSLGKGDTATVMIDELKASHNPDDVDGQEWLVAEVASDDLSVGWGDGVEVSQENVDPVAVDTTTCTSGDACITYPVTEPLGQSDVVAQLEVTCASDATTGLYSVVVKGIDAPVKLTADDTPVGEEKPSDNAQRSVIMVWCGSGAGTPDSIGDADGLYARWTLFQSMGSSGLNIPGDMQKSYAGTPSFPSDSGYVERYIDLECYWLDADGCPTCDTDPVGDPGHGFIDEVESWSDQDLVDRGTINAFDADRDCAMAAAKAQPGHPVDSLDTLLTGTGPTCDGDANWVVYSQEPNFISHNKAADRDCDGLVDGIERAYGSNALAPDTDGDGATDFVEMFQFSNPLNPDTDGDGLKDAPENNYIAAAVYDPGASVQPACLNNWDDDGDKFINDGCPALNAAETACGDNLDNDSDGRINDGCPIVATTAEGSATVGEKGEAANADDNCPGAYNPDQANNDGGRRDNGPIISDIYASNPNQDKAGDACDADDDNDGLPDAYETTTAHSNPFVMDSDSDGVIDGYEVIYGYSATSAASKAPWNGAESQTLARGCHVNLPLAGTYGSSTGWDAEWDGTPNDVEMNLDGDNQNCPADPDSDNGRATGDKLAAPDQFSDQIEAFAFGLEVANKDTDGDGCEDWIEIVDVNGSRQSNIVDVLIFAQRGVGGGPGTTESDKLLDLNKLGGVNITDVLLAAKNSTLVKPQTPATCLTEN
jgi:hypothetical protein